MSNAVYILEKRKELLHYRKVYSAWIYGIDKELEDIQKGIIKKDIFYYLDKYTLDILLLFILAMSITITIMVINL